MSRQGFVQDKLPAVVGTELVAAVRMVAAAGMVVVVAARMVADTVADYNQAAVAVELVVVELVLVVLLSYFLCLLTCVINNGATIS